MKTVVLCGGKGTRLGERTSGLIPKPMVPVAGRPLLWHVMSCFAEHGFKDFVLPLGHMGGAIKRYWLDHNVMACPDVTFSFVDHEPKVKFHLPGRCDWNVRCVDTGEDSQTWDRLKKVRSILDLYGDTFLLTYGDGLCDVDVNELVKYHKQTQALVTVTAVRPPSRFGALTIDDRYNEVIDFSEKMMPTAPAHGNTIVYNRDYINGGFMAVSMKVFSDEYLAVSGSFETDILPRIADEGELMAYKYDGYWQCVDTPKDLDQVNADWNGGKPKWIR